jgi:hypothetical protein
MNAWIDRLPAEHTTPCVAIVARELAPSGALVGALRDAGSVNKLIVADEDAVGFVEVDGDAMAILIGGDIGRRKRPIPFPAIRNIPVGREILTPDAAQLKHRRQDAAPGS